ncbi:MAG: LuxR C-terminal-related transcriptional regulator [Verrucomicrobiota bacterium]
MESGSSPRLRPAEAIANSFAELHGVGMFDRDVYSSILRGTVEGNAQFLGAWNVWEPNALDGRDNDFRNAPGHDATGRVVTYWHRNDGEIQLDPVTGYDDIESRDWYRLPRQTQRMRVVDPYPYPVGGKTCVIMSQVAPIVLDGKGVGVVGIDVSMETWAEGVLKGGSDSSPDLIDETLARGCVLLDDSQSILLCTSRAQSLLERYYNISKGRSGELPAELSFSERGGGEPRRVDRHRETPPLAIRHVRLSKVCHSLVLLSEHDRSSDMSLRLTPREKEVRHWLSQGKSNEEIAIILGISPHTVKNHLNKVFDKLGVHNRYAAALVDDE